MQPRDILDTAKILILAIARAFPQWVAIIAIGAGITILCFTFGGPDIDATMVKPGIVEVIIGGSYVLTTTFSIWNANVKNRAFYFLIMGISIAIATVAVLLFKGFSYSASSSGASRSGIRSSSPSFGRRQRLPIDANNERAPGNHPRPSPTRQHHHGGLFISQKFLPSAHQIPKVLIKRYNAVAIDLNIKPMNEGFFRMTPASDNPFENHGSANDNTYNQRKRAPSQPKEEVIPKIKLGNKYELMALAPDGGLEKAIAEWKRSVAREYLLKNEILGFQDDTTILLDEETLKNESWTRWKHHTRPEWQSSNALAGHLNVGKRSTLATLEGKDIIDVLLETKATSKDSDQEIPVTALPHSIEEVLSGQYPKCHMKPWEMPTATTRRSVRPLTLTDGSITNLAELHIASIVQELSLVAEANGSFSIIDPKTNNRVTVNTTTVTRKLLPDYGASKNDRIQLQPGAFIQQHCPNLVRLGILNPSDFKKLSPQGFESTPIAPSDRKLSLSPHISLQTPGGKSSRYYIGRDTIVGTEIPIDRNSMIVRYLDNQTCGIIRITNTTEEVITTFKLLSPEEVQKKRDALKEKFLSEGKELAEKDVAAWTIVQGKEMASRMKEYSVTDYLEPIQGETPKDYARRAARLSDARLISKQTRDFFQNIGIGIHALPWSEQLGASSILIDPRFQKDTVVDFCKKYGVSGLRTFISSTFGENISQEIFSLAGKFSPEIIKDIFEKYAGILDLTTQIREYLKQEFSKDADENPELMNQIAGNLLNRGKHLLLSFSRDSKKSTPELLKKLDAIKTDNELLLSTVKALREGGEITSLTEIASVSPIEVTGTEITPELQKAMTDLYEKNYPLQKNKNGPGYSKEFQDALIEGLRKSFNNPHTRFQLVMKDGVLIAFLRFEDRGTNEDGKKVKYFGSFNVDPVLHGSRLGDIFLSEVLAREKKDSIIHAYADPAVPISRRYIEKDGFIGVGIERVADRDLLDIVFNADQNSKLRTKKAVSLATDPDIIAGVTASEIQHKETPTGTPLSSSDFRKDSVLTRAIERGSNTIYIFEQFRADTNTGSTHQAA